jgi:FkbM family methyltransferase
MHYDFLEIGTCDFDTMAAQWPEQRGISIEPVPFYFMRLPHRTNLTRIHAAISDRPGRLDIFYLDPEAIAEFGLPAALRGCSAVGQPHPTVVQYLKDHHLDPETLIKHSAVRVMTIADVVKECQITTLGSLKVDTEGYDCRIMRDFISHCETNPQLWPRWLSFETNRLGVPEEIMAILQHLLKHGYKITEWGDTTCLERPGSNLGDTAHGEDDQRDTHPRIQLRPRRGAGDPVDPLV